MTSTAPATIRPLTMAEAAVPIVALIVLVGLSFYLFGDAGAKGPNQVALVMARMIALVIGRRAGYTARATARRGDRERRRPASARSSSCSRSAR